MSLGKEGHVHQWLAVSEDRLLLHDGLICVADLVSVPSGVTELSDDDWGLPVLDGKTPSELVTIIKKECCTRNTTYASLIEYRLNALTGFWRALREFESRQASNTAREMSLSSQASSGKTASFSSRVSLVLIFPMLRSLSKVDPDLSSETAQILLESLRACEPLSLSTEPQDCISGLENMLHSWLDLVQGEGPEASTLIQNAASALVALAVAVGTGSLLLRTVHMLQTLETVHSDLQLLVPGILDKLLQEHVDQEETSTLVTENHLLCWSYDDGLIQSDKDGKGPRSIAFNGQFVYITSSSLKHLLKVGSGKRGTIRGFIYASCEIKANWMVLVEKELLVFETSIAGEMETVVCTQLDMDTLQPCGSVKMVDLPSEPLHTIRFMSDGMFVYWVYALKVQEVLPNSITAEKIKQHSVYIQPLTINSIPSSDVPSSETPSPNIPITTNCALMYHGSRIYLQRPLEIDKNSDVVKALMRSNPSYTSSAIVSLLGQSKDDTSGATSMGLSMKMLQNCASYTTGSSLVILAAPPSGTGGRSGMFGTQSGHTSKALCFNFCFSLRTGKLNSQSDLQPSTQLHCALANGASVETMAACYDPRNHCVWTTNDDWVDIWDCAGKVKISTHQLACRLGHAGDRDFCYSELPPTGPLPNALPISEAIGLLLRYIGIESCRLVPGLEFSSLVVHSLPLSFLGQCCDLLEMSIENKRWANAQAVIITLQVVLPAFFNTKKYTGDEVSPYKERIRNLVWSLLTSVKCRDSLLAETRRIISLNAELLFLDHKDCSKFINTLKEADSSQPQLVSLRDELLVNIASNIQTSSSPSLALKSVAQLVKENIVSDSIAALRQCFQLPADQLPTISAVNPIMTPSLQCASMLMSLNLHGLTFALQEMSDKETEEGEETSENEDDSKLKNARLSLLDLCNDLDLFAACKETLQEIINLASSLSIPLKSSPHSSKEEDSSPSSCTPMRFQAIERTMKCSILGCILQPLLVVISNPVVCTLQMANTLQRNLSTLIQLMAQVCGLLFGTDSLPVQVPAPWATGRTLETLHPVKDNYRFKEIVTFPGAKNLYLKFDPRCSSQYDYDKVIVYAGDSTSGSKVAEYGGNTLGFGSRSVLGKGWPKDIVKVDGDSVTITFEMKSGREHSTPDKAMWGFSCTIRPQESSADASSRLPFITDLYLSLVTVCCSLIGRLYSGPHPRDVEGKCKELMQSELLRRCVWPVDQGTPDNLPLDEKLFPFFSPSPHIPLPSVVIDKLRELANKPRPPLRPSYCELIQPDAIEEVVISVCLKQHGTSSPLELLGQTLEGSVVQAHRDLLEAIFTRINGLERRLQTLAELESNWWHDVADMCQTKKATSTEPFFFPLLQHESSVKSFELLCVLKNVQLNQNDLLSTAKQLQDLIELDVEKRKTSDGEEPLDYTPMTRNLVRGVLERAELLLNVTLSHGNQPSFTLAGRVIMGKHSFSPTAVSYNRSVSAPTSTFDLNIRKQRSWAASTSSKQALLDVTTSTDNSNLLDQIFQFIGSKPEEAVACDSFMSAAARHWRRGVCRVRALGYLQQLLTSGFIGLALDHLLSSVGSVLQSGLCVDDIACGGMAEKVRDGFGSVMQAVVELASKQPTSCINTIAMLCIVPYTRLEEGCLVRSGLVKLLDQLCNLVDSTKPLEVGIAAGESLHRVTSLSWASFQVLADQCVSWESQDSTSLASGLAQQVSFLLTNHLSRAMDRLVVSEGGASETLQDALSLLLGLAKSYMGRAILSQPACVSKLLLLLTDERPSPKLVLIALQLCRIALPLMSMVECSQVALPIHSSTLDHAPFGGKTGSDVASQIVGLLLAKLAEYIVPDSSQVSSEQLSSDGHTSPLETDHPPHLSQGCAHKDEEAFDLENGQASVFVYKRENENAADILQPLISQDPRQFRRLAAGHRMQEVMQMDKALTQNGVAEIITDTYRSCVRRALRWANMGFTVSVGTPTGGTGEIAGSAVDKKKAKSEFAARKKNMDLFKTDPPRPFVSGHVAYSLASEVIGLLNGLLTEPGAARVWSRAIKHSMLQTLVSVPKLAPQLAAYTKSVSDIVTSGGEPNSPGELFSLACIANATFAALGGFKESIRPGMKVQVVGEGMEESYGIIQSISERRGLANVQFEDDELCFGPNKIIEVPISRLLPPQKDTLPLRQLGVQKELCKAIVSLLEANTPSPTHASSDVDANTSPFGLCRLFSEMRTRACVALSHHVQNKDFAELFLEWKDEVSSGLDKLSNQARFSNPGVRVSLIETHCQSLRMLYRDCSRPTAPRLEKPRRELKTFKLDITRVWPPVTSSSFTHQLTCLTYQGPTGSAPHTPSSLGNGDAPATNQPKGVVVYSTSSIPPQAPSFYWELEVLQLGDSSTDIAHIAMGYSPAPEEPDKDQPWAYPVGTCFIRSSGRGCQVTGDNSLEWNTFRLNNPFASGDIVGCGWVKNEDGNLGIVYFTLNGERQGSEFKDILPETFPFLHIQKKATRVRVNLGDRSFLYSEGSSHREAANILEQGDTTEEVVANFDALPFAVISSDSEGEAEKEDKKGPVSVVELTQNGPPTRKLRPPIATVGYDHKASLAYSTIRSFDTMLESGPLIRPGGGEIESEDVEEDEGHSAPQEEDIHSLLVKAWETKVFPVIQRRFRNDQERKSGLEQIKGALQLGMESIAQETVEFLYEENGGIPKDLHLPTMDDVKAELGKFTVSRIRKGSAVVIQRDLPYVRCGVRTMQKTQGLTGIVLDVEEFNEVIQVECYLQNEGALVRFWYPLVYLERPPPGYRRSPALRGADAANMLVHRELLQCEGTLASLYCRRALLRVKQVLEHSMKDLVEHLHLVSAECFAEPLPEGLSTTTSPDLAPSPSSALHTLTLSPLHLFYSDVDRVRSEIQYTIQGLATSLVALSGDLCECLQKTPQSFSSAEIKVTETKEAIDLAYPEAAFMVVSCVDDRAASSVPTSSTYKYPWGRVLCYRGGQGKEGRQQMQEVARYPNEIIQSSSNQYCGPTYPTLLLPFSRIHVKVGGCNVRPGKILQILALPAGFPLVLSFADTLAKHTLDVFQTDRHSDEVMECGCALSVCLENLCKVISRLNCPQLLKVSLLHLIADILWTLCTIFPPSSPADQSDASGLGESGRAKLYLFQNEFLLSVRQELMSLYETESTKFSPGKSKSSSTESACLFPPINSIGSGGSGKLSTYFQAVLEFVLAVTKYQSQFHNSGQLLTTLPTLPTSSVTLAPSLTPPTIARSTSSDAAPGDSSAVLTPSSSASWATPTSLSDVSKKPSKRTRSRKSFSKKEDPPDPAPDKKDDWLSTVHQATNLLRGVVLDNPSSYLPHLKKASLATCQQRTKPNSRLVVVTGIDIKLSIELVRKGIQKVCNTYGGLYKGILYLPTELCSDIEDSLELKGDEDNKESEETSKTDQEEDVTATDNSSGSTDKEIDNPPKERLLGYAVLELCSLTQVSPVTTTLLSSPSLKSEDSIQVCAVGDRLTCGDDKLACSVLIRYLREKLVEDNHLKDSPTKVLSQIFKTSAKSASTQLEISLFQVANDLRTFLGEIATEKGISPDDLASQVWKAHSDERGLLSLDKFLLWVNKLVGQIEGQGVKQVWLGLLASGFDFHFERYVFPPDFLSCPLTTEQDYALIHHVDSLCRNLATPTATLEPWDITLTDAQMTSHKLSPLQGLSLEDIRVRFLQLKYINSQLSPLFTVIDLRCPHPLSLGHLLCKVSSHLFYDSKVFILHSVLNASTRRSFDQAPPEIKMDPLESVSGFASTPLNTHFCQAAQQLSTIPSAQLCIPLASGGDPTYAFNVKMSGEEVHGTSGSFRHFLWQVVRELQSFVLPILQPCPSGATGVNHGKYILAYGKMTFSEEKLLQFFGQLLGVAIRADMPIALDLLLCFWKSLKEEPLSLADLKEADCVTYKFTSKILEFSTPEEYEEFVSGIHHERSVVDEDKILSSGSFTGQRKQGLKFVYNGLDGVEMQLCEGGKEEIVEYSNRHKFVAAVREFRLRELACSERMKAVRCGLASVIPLEVLGLLTAEDLDLRVCGLPHIDLEYLRRHTMYQVGLMETDKHVQFFWHALESFSQDELRKFIKFACNQERIPFGHPCREGSRDHVMHVPPYPMKIAPPDGKGPPDSRYIRAETCMFMIKLPQYSSQEIMTERLRYAIHCREDPLSG